MNCDEVRDRLSEYLDEEMASAERSELVSHIERCRSCASELETIRRTVELVSSLPRLSAPPELAREVRTRISAGAAVFTKRLFALAGAAAVILVAFLLVFNLLGESKIRKSGEEKVATEKEPAPASGAEKLLTRQSGKEEAQKPHLGEPRGKNLVGEEKAKSGELTVAEAEPNKNLAESHKIVALADARPKEEKQMQREMEKLANASAVVTKAGESYGIAGQGTETADRAKRQASAPVEVVESEITIPTSDLKKDLDKIESFLAQISPGGGQEWKIAREVSEDGAITVLVDCGTENQYRQLVDRVSRLKASPDSGARAAPSAIAGAKSTEDLAKDKESEARETGKALKEERAKGAGLEPESSKPPAAPAAGEADQKKPAEQRAGETSEEAEKARLPERSEEKLGKEGAAGQPQTALPKTQEQAVIAGGGQIEVQKKQVQKRYIVRVKLVIVDKK
jgi:anti-sigma factor (TIGR02949 family)